MVLIRKALLPIVCCVLSWHALLAQTVPTRLGIVVVQGEGSANRIHSRAGQDPVVRVEDQDGRVVEGAAVVFSLPTSGASGEFDKGSKSITILTDEKGLATARGLKTNDAIGKLAIHVSASYRGQAASATITEFNMAPDGAKKSGSGKLILILAVVGGAAAGGVFAASHKSGSTTNGSSSVGTIILSPGSSTVGAPH